jgi:hypothetical protein
MDILVVNLEIRAPEEVFACRRLTYETKHIAHSAWYNSGFFVGAAEGIGFARCCLAVSEDDSVVAFHGSVHMGPGDGGIYGFVWGPSEDGVEVECGWIEP